MTAFLFSEVITCGFEMTLTRLSAASALIIAKNLSVANVNAVRPAPGSPATAVAAPIVDGSKPVGGAIGGTGSPVLIDRWAARKGGGEPWGLRSAQALPSRESSFDVKSPRSPPVS